MLSIKLVTPAMPECRWTGLVRFHESRHSAAQALRSPRRDRGYLHAIDGASLWATLQHGAQPVATKNGGDVHDRQAYEQIILAMANSSHLYPAHAADFRRRSSFWKARSDLGTSIFRLCNFAHRSSTVQFCTFVLRHWLYALPVGLSCSVLAAAGSDSSRVNRCGIRMRIGTTSN